MSLVMSFHWLPSHKNPFSPARAAVVRAKNIMSTETQARPLNLMGLPSLTEEIMCLAILNLLQGQPAAWALLPAAFSAGFSALFSWRLLEVSSGWLFSLSPF